MKASLEINYSRCSKFELKKIFEMLLQFSQIDRPEFFHLEISSDILNKLKIEVNFTRSNKFHAIYLLELIRLFKITKFGFVGKISYNIQSENFITFDKIEKEVCEYFHQTPEVLYKKNWKNELSKKRAHVLPRHTMMVFSIRLIKASLNQAGERYGGVNHASVINAKRSINNLYETNPLFRSQFKEIEAKLMKSN